MSEYTVMQQEGRSSQESDHEQLKLTKFSGCTTHKSIFKCTQLNRTRAEHTRPH
jgi:hypothetical protein